MRGQFLFLLSLFFLLACSRTKAQEKTSGQIELPNGWALTPAGHSLALSSDLPLNMAVSPDGRFVAVANSGGGREGIDLMDLKTNKLVQNITIRKAWLGLAFEQSRPYLYVSGGDDNIIIRFELKHGSLIARDSLQLDAPWPKEKVSPTGISLDEQHHLLFVVTKGNNALYVCDTKTMKVLYRRQLSGEAYSCIFNAKRRELYISGWGREKIWVYDTERNLLIDSIATGKDPNDLTLSKTGEWLYVANANSNSISVVRTANRQVVETLNAALYPGALIGSTTNAVALSEDNKTLYVANADNNCLAVFDVSRPGSSFSKGFIPTGWYPTGVKVVGQKILVLNGKGISSFPNTRQFSKALDGTLSIIDIPGASLLNRYARQVYLNTPYTLHKEAIAEGEEQNPIPRKRGDTTPIRYVFYVIKENQTYDNILGDMPEGNGDSGLCLFGRNITPNAHDLSKRFTLFDNFYVDGEVSVDGHQWSTAAYATDYVEKQWPYDYSGRGGEHTFDGIGADSIGTPPKGFIWDYAYRAGISFRNYGEFMGWREVKGFSTGYNPGPGLLKDPAIFCPGYPGWNLGIQDVYREKIFEHDFDSLVKIQAVRQFNVVYFPQDHTSGQAMGAYTPTADVADNDLALGRLIGHISQSPIWRQTAIFVLEDDPGGRWDHVDLHRSVAYVISPYIKRNFVDHTLYSTASMLRTMELILGLPPMSQYDAAATPMWRCFTSRPDWRPYTALTPATDIQERNGKRNKSAKISERFDLSMPDAVPGVVMGETIWKSVKGEGSRMPAPVRAAFVKYKRGDDDDD